MNSKQLKIEVIAGWSPKEPKNGRRQFFLLAELFRFAAASQKVGDLIVIPNNFSSLFIIFPIIDN